MYTVPKEKGYINTLIVTAKATKQSYPPASSYAAYLLVQLLSNTAMLANCQFLCPNFVLINIHYKDVSITVRTRSLAMFCNCGHVMLLSQGECVKGS